MAAADPHVALARVEIERRKGRWTGEVLLEAASGEVREHLLHLKGLALFQQRRYGEARDTWRSATSTHCSLAPLIELAAALAGVERGEVGETAEPGLVALVAAVVRADDLLAAGDIAAARDVLDIAWIRDRREEQSLARLVAGYLDGPPPDDVPARFRMATTLAAFVADFAEASRHSIRLPLADRTWDGARIEGLVARAADWLRRL